MASRMKPPRVLYCATEVTGTNSRTPDPVVLFRCNAVAEWLTMDGTPLCANCAGVYRVRYKGKVEHGPTELPR